MVWTLDYYLVQIGYATCPFCLLAVLHFGFTNVGISLLYSALVSVVTGKSAGVGHWVQRWRYRKERMYKATPSKMVQHGRKFIRKNREDYNKDVSSSMDVCDV